MAVESRFCEILQRNVSQVAFGCSSLGGVFGPVSQEASNKVVEKALGAGINYFDTAPFYGNSEERLGCALQRVSGRFPRDFYFLATKVGRYPHGFDFSAEKTRSSVLESLSKLQTDYIDLVQVHDLEFCEDPEIILKETLQVLLEFQSKGLIKFIGITGYFLEKLKWILDYSWIEINVVLTYCHLTLQNQQLVEWLASKRFGEKTAVINAAPLAMGLFTTYGPPEWHPASPRLKDKCRKVVELCQQHSVDPAQVALVFALNESRVSTTIVGVKSEEELDLVIASTNESLDSYETLIQQIFKDLDSERNTEWKP